MKTKHKPSTSRLKRPFPNLGAAFLMRDNPRCNHVNLMAVGVDPLYSRCSFLAIDTRQGRDKA